MNPNDLATASKPRGRRPIKNLPVGEPPSCKCGCGELTVWNRRKNRWNRYVIGHYQRARGPYRDATWLREQYVDLRRTTWEIAAEFGIGHGSILKWMKKHDIPRRDRSEARIGRRIAERNPAWKGGVARRYPPGWRRIAREIRERDNETCQDCGKPQREETRRFDVHHRDGDKSNNHPENLITLCNTCHLQAHADLARAAA